MSNPLLRVHLSVIRRNTEAIVKKCAGYGISVWGVTKGLSAPVELAAAMRDTGITAIADSRLANIKRMKNAGIDLPFALIRIPMRSELEEMLDYADISMASDLGTLRELAALCEKKKKNHAVILMVDLGDLREGFLTNQVEEVASAVSKLNPSLRIMGVGVNFACASGVLANSESLQKLLVFGGVIESALGRKLEIYSGGGTAKSLAKIDEGLFPAGINNLRIGEGCLLGTDKCYRADIPWLEKGTMELEAELVEVRVKPTLPVGEIGLDAFGNAPCFEDRGNRLRGILAVGKQDVYIDSLTPLDEGVQIITASSDHLLVDLEECPEKPKVGDILKFRPAYPAMLSLSTSPYVTKVYED